MKSTFVVGLAGLFAAANASPQAKGKSTGKTGTAGGGSGLGKMMNPGYGLVSPGPNPIVRRVEEKTRTPQVANSKTVKIRYGPYKVPNANKKSIGGESGMLWNLPHLNVDRPCTGDCILLGISAGLEYLDGKEADTDTGMWLHHMVAFTVGPKRMDPTCVGKLSLPHLLMGASPASSERFFSVGNEKTPAPFNPPWVKDQTLGYHLYQSDKFSFIVDLMNQNKEDKVVYMYLTYDYIDGHPKGIDNIKALWLDVAQCGTSEVVPPVQKGKFTSKYSWTANIEGEILGAGGHIHDGGVNLVVKVDGKTICDSVATYGKGEGAAVPGMAPAGAGGMEGGGGHSHGGAGGEHITSMSTCWGDKLGLTQLKKGQKWSLEANYDYDKYPGMKLANGKQSNVMGISVVYVKNPKV